MSNAVYPTLPGLMFGVQRNVLAPPVQVRTTPSRREYRARDATVPLYQYSLAYEFLRSRAALAELQTLVGFYNLRGGPFDSFLFTDPDDCAVADELFGVQTGALTTFQLGRAFGGFYEALRDFNGTPLLKVAGVPVVNLLAPYASFEADTNADGLADGWSTYSAGTTGKVTYTRIGSGAVDGTYKQRLQASNLGTTLGDIVGVYRAAPVVAGVPYTLSASFGTATGAPHGALWINWLNGSGGYISTSSDVSISSLGTLTRYSYTATAPTGAASAHVYLMMHTLTGGPGLATLDVDAVQFQPGSAATAFSNYTASIAANGVVTFNVPPPDGAAMTWTGAFYRRCRFEGDQLDTTKFMRDLWEAKKVELLSVLA
jgi:hypothetical protein